MPRLSNNDRNQALGKRCWRCRGVISGHMNSRLARRPFSRSLRRTVAELIRGLCLPERLAAYCINEVDRWGGANVMIWAAVSFRYKSPLHFCDRSLTGKRYRDEILTSYVVPSNRQVFHFDVSKPLFDRLHSKYRNGIRPKTTLPAIFTLSIANGF
jgi:hypothetical protein